MHAPKITSIGEAPDNAYRRSKYLRRSDTVIRDALEKIPQSTAPCAFLKNALDLRPIKPAMAGKPL
jgi:hypothetical protein